ncbi:hypothetical protein E2562_035673 [Oryza meyeriana var. granulata]|uniref:Major facilitator superfamily (MFS) profile domain-containing protein n=1 Tax=Oryza meyeriana var. granulata TaxID=110450 RepID=A0A6G1E801_9ORYZ|nr:hypothetical protein E2562_035673 [Oryza meyeriana var. granulata]
MVSNTAILILDATVAVGVVNTHTSSILVGTSFTDRLGRRRLVLAGIEGVAVALTLCMASPMSVARERRGVVPRRVWAHDDGDVHQGDHAAAVACSWREPEHGREPAVVPVAWQEWREMFAYRSPIPTDGITMPACFFQYASVAVTAWVFACVRSPEMRSRSRGQPGRGSRPSGEQHHEAVVTLLMSCQWGSEFSISNGH